MSLFPQLTAEEREGNFFNFDLMSAFGLEMCEGENQIKINQTLNKRIKKKCGGRRVQKKETICRGQKIFALIVFAHPYCARKFTRRVCIDARAK